MTGSGRFIVVNSARKLAQLRIISNHRVCPVAPQAFRGSPQQAGWPRPACAHCCRGKHPLLLLPQPRRLSAGSSDGDRALALRQAQGDAEQRRSARPACASTDLLSCFAVRPRSGGPELVEGRSASARSISWRGRDQPARRGAPRDKRTTNLIVPFQRSGSRPHVALQMTRVLRGLPASEFSRPGTKRS